MPQSRASKCTPKFWKACSASQDLVNPNYAIGAELALAVLFGLAIIVAAPMLPASIVIVLGGCLIAGLIGLSLYLFVEHNLLIDFTYPLISSWLIYLVLTFVNYLANRNSAGKSARRSAIICRRTWWSDCPALAGKAGARRRGAAL